MSTSNSREARTRLRNRTSTAQLRAVDRGDGAPLIEEITTTAALEGLRPEWERLWGEAPRATPFQSPRWLLPWWRHIGRGTLAAIAIRSAGARELVALAPLYVYPNPATGRRHLFPIGIVTTDYLDVVAKPGREECVVRCLASHLAQRAAHWDVLEFPHLRREAPLLGLVAPEGWRREVVEGEPNPVLTLRFSQGGAGPPIPRSMAQNIRTARSRAARAGNLRFEMADAQTLPTFLDALVRLHARRWSERGFAGAFNDECVLASHREAAPLLQAAGLLRLHALRLDGEFIAVMYCLADAAPAHERRCYYYLGGFDPRFGALSPGTLLVAHAIEQAMAEGATAFDFLRGAEAYKYRWGAVNQPMYTLRLWPDTTRSSRRA